MVTSAMDPASQGSVDSSRLGELEQRLEDLSMELRISQGGTKKWRMVTVVTMATLCACAIVAMIMPLATEDPREPALRKNIEGVRDQAKTTVQLGTIVAWVPYPSKSSKRASLPDGWLPRNGTTITKGPWKDQTTPDLNNGRFLRGSEEGQALDVEEDQLLEHSHKYSIIKHTDSSSGNVCGIDSTVVCSPTSSLVEKDLITGARGETGETRPKSMVVVYIIKCW